jgi:hypothetical protein
MPILRVGGSIPSLGICVFKRLAPGTRQTRFEKPKYLAADLAILGNP